MQDNNKPSEMFDLLSSEKDLYRRMALISFGMDVLKDPQSALFSYNVPEGFYGQWEREYKKGLIEKVAGTSAEQITNKDKLTPEQQKAFEEAVINDQLARIGIVMRSNYNAAIEHIVEYCEARDSAEWDNIYSQLWEAQTDTQETETPVNVPILTVLYFFATHETIDPRHKNSLEAEHKAAIIELFNDIDEFYRAHYAEFHSMESVARAYIESLNIAPENAEKAISRISGIENARREGAITSIGGILSTYSDKGLSDVFTSKHLWKLEGDLKEESFDKTGKMELFATQGKNLKRVPFTDANIGFLMFTLKLAKSIADYDVRELRSKDNPNIKLYLPTIFSEIKVDPRPRSQKRNKEKELCRLRVEKLIEYIDAFSNVVCYLPNDGYYKIASFVGWDENTDVAVISIPLAMRLVEKSIISESKYSAIRDIFKANVLTENQTAVELANRIAVGLIERGVTTPDKDTYKTDRRKPVKTKVTKITPDGTKTIEEKTFQPEAEKSISKSRTDADGVTTTIICPRREKSTYTYDAKFSTLIDECPEIKMEIDKIKNGIGNEEKAARDADKSAQEIIDAKRKDHANDPQRINKKLKDIFTSAIRIVMEKSEIPEYYAGIKIVTRGFETFKAPTNSTLGNHIVITHNGKNSSYKG